MKKLSVFILLVLPIMASSAFSDEMNLATCLLGEYADICDHDLLTEEQAIEVERAEAAAKGLSESSIDARLEEASRAAKARKSTTRVKYVDYTLDFGRGNHAGTVIGGGRSIDNPNRTIDGRDKAMVSADRKRERAYDKAIRNVRGTSVQSVQMRAELEHQKIAGMSSEYSDRDRERAYDKAIRNVRGTSVQSVQMRAELEHQKIAGMSSEYSDRDRERAYDKAIRNVRGTSAQSALIRAELEIAKLGGAPRIYHYSEKRSLSNPTLSKNQKTGIDDWDAPSPMLSNRREPIGAIDVTTGTFIPKVAGGYIDPRNGTFHIDAAGGVINTKTGAFSPIIR